MSYKVSNYDTDKITLNESDEVASVLQNIRVLLGTWQGNVPLYRDYGIDPELLHKPINVVEPLLVANITDSIEEYEPRANVLSVTFSTMSDRPDTLGITVEVEVETDNGEEYSV